MYKEGTEVVRLYWGSLWVIKHLPILKRTFCYIYDMRVHRLLNIIIGLIVLGLILAIIWIWWGHFSALERDRLARLDDEGALNFLNLPTSTSKPIIVSSTSIKATIKRASISTTSSEETVPRVLRTAVSPLTGTLELGDNDINLDVPYTSQAPERVWTQPWQDACEEAAILMLDAYYRGYGLSTLSAKDELQKMVNWEEDRGWERSISIEKIKIILQEYYKITRPIRIISNPTVADIKGFIAAGKPVLAVADGRLLPNPYYSNGGPAYHAFIIRGYTADKFITNDPGVNRGKDFIFPIDAVMDSLRDWNDGNVAQGVPVVLVIE